MSITRQDAASSAQGADVPAPAAPQVTFDTEPGRYRHWKLATDGPVATLWMDVAEDGGLVPGYELKMNSYDLGVHIELYDAVQRLRFEHPEVRSVIVTSLKERMFCAGANIRMLAESSHAWKVNFCKFTNETLAEASRTPPPALARPTSRHSTARPRAAATSSRLPATR